MTTEKVCPFCTRLLPLDAFPPHRNQCKQCRAAVRSHWYYQNKKRLTTKKRAYMRVWRARNPGYDGRKTPQAYNPVSQKVYKAKYRANHRERLNAAARDYYQRNRERILAAKKRKKLMRALS